MRVRPFAGTNRFPGSGAAFGSVCSLCSRFREDDELRSPLQLHFSNRSGNRMTGRGLNHLQAAFWPVFGELRQSSGGLV